MKPLTFKISADRVQKTYCMYQKCDKCRFWKFGMSCRNECYEFIKKYGAIFTSRMKP